MTWFEAHSTGVKTYLNSGQKFVAVEVTGPRGGSIAIILLDGQDMPITLLPT